jgi:hypothetical protein
MMTKKIGWCDLRRNSALGRKKPAERKMSIVYYMVLRQDCVRLQKMLGVLDESHVPKK